MKKKTKRRKSGLVSSVERSKRANNFFKITSKDTINISLVKCAAKFTNVLEVFLTTRQQFTNCRRTTQKEDLHVTTAERKRRPKVC